MNRHFLNGFFEPDSIALVGASDRPDSQGFRVLRNLQQKPFTGTLYPVHPKHRKIAGLRVWPRLQEIGARIDLVVITSPAETILDTLDACAELHIDSVVILTPMRQLSGSRDAWFQEQIQSRCKKHSIKLIGPNGFGVISPHRGLRLTHHEGDVLEGGIALVSQSSAICSAIVDWAKGNGVGFSHIVCLEQMLGLDIGDVLDFLLTDLHTESIMLYIEGVHDARRFVSGLRAAARGKPVIALKAGRHIRQASETMLHTGALVGNDDVFNAAFDRAGVVRADAINDLFLGARAFAVHRKVQGGRMAVIANGNAPNIMACDKAFDLGITLSALGAQTSGLLAQQLHGTISTQNPVQLAADADADQFKLAYECVEKDPDVDIILIIFTPQLGAVPRASAQQIISVAQQSRKALITCWMGDQQVAEARRLFQASGIPAFSTPENAVKAVHYLVTYYRNRQLLLQTPEPLTRKKGADHEGARMIIEGVLQEGRKSLNQLEAKAILRAFQVPVTQGILVHSPNEALVAAESVGFPVVLKISSPDIAHKTDAEGVMLGITNAQSVRSAYNLLLERVKHARPAATVQGVIVEPMSTSSNNRELLLGIKTDPVFGPVILFGAGGTMVEVMRDCAVSLPPLNEFLARNLIQQTRIRKVLGAFRHLPSVNQDILVDMLVRLSEIASELPWIRHLEINPLLADEHAAVAVDVRIDVDFIKPAQERYSHMAIHPYPVYWITHWQLKDGTDIEIRPIRPEDAGIEKEFIEGLSPQSRYYRFMHTLKQVSPEMLVRFTQIDYHRELALIAVIREKGREREIGVSRYVLNVDGDSCEFAVVVADAWQHTGIGYKLMEKLIEAARQKGFARMEGVVLRDNKPMQRLARSMGFEVHRSEEDEDVVSVVKIL